MGRPNALKLALLVSSIAAGQQAPLPVMPAYVQTESTGVVGILGSQAARLNVLNLAGAAAPAGTAASCAAHVAFVDDQGTVLKSADVTVDPGKAVGMDYTPPAGSRQQFRVTIGITRPVTVAPAAGSGIAMPIFFCSLVPTLEILDAPGSKTNFVISDFHFVTPGLPIMGGVATGAPPMR